MKTMRVALGVLVGLGWLVGAAMAQYEVTIPKIEVPAIEVPQINIKVDTGTLNTGTAVMTGEGVVAESDFNIIGNKVVRVLECKGQPVSIAGSHCQITINGECPSVSVMGSHNHVVIAEIPELSLSGSHNHLTVKKLMSLNLGGSHNNLVIEALGNASVLGSYNNLSWGAGIEGDPQISVLGRNNNVTKAAR